MVIRHLTVLGEGRGGRVGPMVIRHLTVLGEGGGGRGEGRGGSLVGKKVVCFSFREQK